jgi:hypothetical protein
VKSVVPDSQAALASLDRKTRLAAMIVRDRGWRPLVVGKVLFLGEGTTSRRRVARHGALFDAALPVRGRGVLRWLRAPTTPIAGLLFIRPTPASTSRALGLGQRPSRPAA